MESQGLDVLQLLGIFRRQLRLILLVAGTSVGLTLVILLTLKPIYAASALVLVDPSHKNLLAASDAPAAPADGPRVDSEAALVTSPATLREVIKDADLLNEPEFGSRAGWFDAVLRALQAEPPASAAGDAQTALDGLVRAVTATRVGTTYLIDVSAGAHSAALSATLANAVARRYIDEQRQAKVDAVLASRDIVASQLASANASVVAAEDAIDAFMMANVASIAPKIVGADIPQIRDRLRQRSGACHRQRELARPDDLVAVGDHNLALPAAPVPRQRSRQQAGP
jgi:succinoglycan biosynthesis transport protein ExoP